MTLMCGCEEDYVDIPEEFSTSWGTEFCAECKEMIPAGSEYYRVRLWAYSEDGNEIERGIFPHCESCADLLASVLELGYCVEFGSLREDVRELAEIGR